jgi:hypothetical protein
MGDHRAAVWIAGEVEGTAAETAVEECQGRDVRAAAIKLQQPGRSIVDRSARFCGESQTFQVDLVAGSEADDRWSGIPGSPAIDAEVRPGVDNQSAVGRAEEPDLVAGGAGDGADFQNGLIA